MAANYVSDGLTKTVILGSGEITFGSGAFYLTGDMGGVVLSLTRAGVPVTGAVSAQYDVAVLGLKGVYELPKIAATVIGDGVKVYYDPATKLITPTAGSLKEVGWAWGGALSADTTVKVLLKG